VASAFLSLLQLLLLNKIHKQSPHEKQHTATLDTIVEKTTRRGAKNG
jgi:hypothetical protein